MKIRKISTLAGVAAVSLGLGFAGGMADAMAGGPKHCPPGLAKKGSCTPPGQQKKWHKGDRIPRDVEYRVIADHDRYRVRRPDQGEVYIEIGGDIYLIAEATKRVIEAVNLIDAATK